MSASPSRPAFLPSTLEEMRRRGWDRPDIIIVTGDAHIDSPYIGAAVIGRVLEDAGFRVAVIAQPDISTETDITRLGEPRLFWGITGGSVDSLVANYTASGKRRKSDDLTPGGQNTRRPDRAVIAYSNLIRRHFKSTVPLVLGGIEASLRRVSHFDAWSGKIRRSILFDAKANFLIYGMGEETVAALARRLRDQGPEADVSDIRGLCYIGNNCPEKAVFSAEELPSHEEVARSQDAFIRMFRTFYEGADPVSGNRLCQRQDTRYLIQNPPAKPPSPDELDRIFALPFTRDPHPVDAALGRIPALDTIRFSLTTHRGCYGECRFCAIAVHQGRHVISRSRDSILAEAAELTRHPEFKGVIQDAGGPTANMYGFDCTQKARRGACVGKNCLFPSVCKKLPVDHAPQMALLRDLADLPGVRHVFVGSGIRYDLILADRRRGEAYLSRLLGHHVSGQLKIAPEHVSDEVLSLMGKPGKERLRAFMKLFHRIKDRDRLNLFLTYYLMAAHPGCTASHMRELKEFCLGELKLLPEQIQIFTPTPSTWSTLMYATGKDPFSDRPLFVEKQREKKDAQKRVLRKPPPAGAPRSGKKSRPASRTGCGGKSELPNKSTTTRNKKLYSREKTKRNQKK